MTDQLTGLSAAALAEVISRLDESISIFERAPARLSVSELHVRSMLTALRRVLTEQLAERQRLETGA
jgi:hypothetical protein